MPGEGEEEDMGEVVRMKEEVVTSHGGYGGA